MSIQLEIVLFSLIGLRVGYLIWRYSQSERHMSLAIILGIGGMLMLAEAILGTMPIEEQFSTGDIPLSLKLFLTLPNISACVGMILAACTERRWRHPTLEMKLLSRFRDFLRLWKKRSKKNTPTSSRAKP